MSSESENENNTQLQAHTYSLHCTADQMILNGHLIDYSEQILDLDKFYIIKAPNNELKTPIILHRSKQIDLLDRRIFIKKFTF